MSESGRSIPTVLVVGPSLKVKGGISAVLKSLLSTSLINKYNFTFVTSHVDGPRLLKLVAAFYGLLRMKYLLSTRTVDLVYIHGSDIISALRKYFFFSVAKSTGTAVVYHFHGGNLIERFSRAPGCAKRRVRILFEDSEIVLCISERWKRELVSIAPRSKIIVIPNGVRLPEKLYRKRLNNNFCVITFLGLVSRAKGVFDLICAVKRLRKSGVNVELRIGGHGDITTLNKEIGRDESIRYLGWLDSAKKNKLYRDTDIFVLPSYFEGMPMVILEAMSYGIPVVSTPVGGIPEVVEDGRTGLLVPPGDVDRLSCALRYLIEHKNIREEFGKAARKRMEEKFNIEKTAEDLDKRFQAVLNTKIGR